MDSALQVSLPGKLLSFEQYQDYQVTLSALLKDPPADLLPPSSEGEADAATPANGSEQSDDR
jgi:hypothetical protein